MEGLQSQLDTLTAELKEEEDDMAEQGMAPFALGDHVFYGKG